MMYRRLRLPRWIQITQAVFMVYVRILFVICTHHFAKGREKLIKQTGSAIYLNYNVTAQHNKASFVSRYIAHIGSSHYRNPALCRVPGSLPCAFYRAHGKEHLYHVHTR